MTKSFLVAIAAVCLLFSCGPAHNVSSSTSPNTLSNKEQKDGWVLLFDGNTKNGWHIFNNRTDGSAWKAADGTLYLDSTAKGPRGAGGGELITDQTFENFHLKLDWKLATAGNSGVIFQAQEDPKYRYAYVTGPEMQILDNDRHPDGKNIKHRAGDLYDMITAVPEAANPVGEWNALEIIADNGKLDLFMNGKKIVSTIQWDDNWNKMIANSKFKNTSDFGKFKNGKIALQDHGNPVWFRNIKIRQL